MRGKISRIVQYAVHCLNCSRHDVYDGWTMKEAEQHFRKWGWSKKKDGWHCPECKLAHLEEAL